MYFCVFLQFVAVATGRKTSNFSHRKTTENVVFSVVFGGDKRDRTADLLNAIDGRGSVRQGQALQKEKPLKYKGFFSISPFRTFYFSASCALDFMIFTIVLYSCSECGLTSTNFDNRYCERKGVFIEPKFSRYSVAAVL